MKLVAESALEDSGIDLSRLASLPVGVFVGAMSAGFLFPVPCYAVARIIAHGFQVDGTKFSSDASCAAGYLAMHHAYRSIMSADCDLALVGAVQLLIRCPAKEKLQLAVDCGKVSGSGSMRPFDVTADGLVLGEGCATVVLQKLAPSDGKAVYATIGGTCSHDTSTLLPAEFVDPSAMQEATEQALKCDNLSSARVKFAHLHGMANKACDIPEVIAMTNVFAAQRPVDAPFVLIGHKSNFGHTEAASGIVAVVLATQILQQKLVPPNFGVHTPHPECLVAGVLLPISDPVGIDCSDRWAGVINGTAASGNNVSIVLEYICSETSLRSRVIDTPSEGIDRVTDAPSRETDRSVSSDCSSSLESQVLLLFNESALIEVGVQGNFFADGGGNSVGMVQLINKLNAKFGCKLRVVDIIKRPTAQAMSTHIVTSNSYDLGTERPDNRSSCRSSWMFWSFILMVPILFAFIFNHLT